MTVSKRLNSLERKPPRHTRRKVHDDRKLVVLVDRPFRTFLTWMLIAYVALHWSWW